MKKFEMLGCPKHRARPRTLQEFVEDLASDGRSLSQILTVAMSSRWRIYKEEIKKEYYKLRG